MAGASSPTRVGATGVFLDKERPITAAAASASLCAEGASRAPGGACIAESEQPVMHYNPGMDSITSQASYATNSSGDSIQSHSTRSNPDQRPLQNAQIREDPREGSPVNLPSNPDISESMTYSPRVEPRSEQETAYVRCRVCTGTKRKTTKKRLEQTARETQSLMDQTFPGLAADCEPPPLTTGYRESQSQDDKIKGLAMKAASEKRVRSTTLPQLDRELLCDSSATLQYDQLMVCSNCGQDLQAQPACTVRLEELGRNSLKQQTDSQLHQSDFKRSLSGNHWRDSGYHGYEHSQHVNDEPPPAYNTVAQEQAACLPTATTSGCQLSLKRHCRAPSNDRDRATLTQRTSQLSISRRLLRRYSSTRSNTDSAYSGSLPGSLVCGQSLRDEAAATVVVDIPGLCEECQQKLTNPKRSPAEPFGEHKVVCLPGDDDNDLDGFHEIDSVGTPMDADLKGQRNYLVCKRRQKFFSKLKEVKQFVLSRKQKLASQD